MDYRKKQIVLWGLSLFLLVIVGCAAGNDKFDTTPAGFWAGLWHGLICFFTFIISLFTDSVRMYEPSNTGGWYDFGFILGAAIFFSGSRGTCKKKRWIKGTKEKEWEEIGEKVEEKIRKGIKNWVEDAEEKDKNWEEIGRKIEEKIKRELRNWAEK